jgi:hypothetical protein
LGYLGISVTILALLGGAFYLFNVKPLKETLEQQQKVLEGLKKQVEDNLSSSKSELRKDLKDFEETNTKNISLLIQQKNEKLISDIQARIANFEKDFTEKFNTFATEKDNDLKTVVLAEFSNQLRVLEKSLNTEISKSIGDIGGKLSSIQDNFSSMKNEMSGMKEDLLDLKIEYHLKKNQIGAIRGMIDKFDITIKKKWGVEGALLQIKEYIKEHGMPDIYLPDLIKSLKNVLEDHKVIKDEILKLANEKLYKAFG